MNKYGQWLINLIFYFKEPAPKARETKAKMNLLDFIRIKSFCAAKETVKKTKRQPTEWKNIFANDATDKRLVSKVYKEHLKLNTRETNNHKMGRRYEQTLFE